VRAQSVIEIAPQAKVKRPVSFGDRILQVEGELFNIGVSVGREKSSSPGQVVRRKVGIDGGACGVVERRIDDAELVVFVQKRLLIGDPRLHVVDTLHIGDIRTNSGICEGTVLAHGLRLQIGREVGEWVAARIVVVLIPPDESPQGQDCVCVQQRIHEGAMLKVLREDSDDKGLDRRR